MSKPAGTRLVAIRAFSAHFDHRAFGGKGYAAGDEIYQQQSPFYNRAKLRVLVSLDFADQATAAASGST